MSNDYGDLFEKWEIAVAKNLISEFRLKWKCMKKEGFEDLLQECLSHWHFSKIKYDCRRKASMQTYMGKVVRHKLMDIVREKNADKRKADYLAISLDEPIENDENSPTLLEKIDATRTIDGNFVPSSAGTGLKQDLSKAISSLTYGQRRFCSLLSEEGLTIKEAADRLNTPRSTLYDDIKKIRILFEREGLKEYLGRPLRKNFP